VKQHITTEQLDFELNDKGKAKLRSWWKPKIGDLYIWHDGWSEKNGFNWTINVVDEEDEAIDGLIWIDGDKTPKYPLLSIGQMIEFLRIDYYHAIADYGGFDWVEPSMVCDALWQAVKEKLEQ